MERSGDLKPNVKQVRPHSSFTTVSMHSIPSLRSSEKFCSDISELKVQVLNNFQKKLKTSKVSKI